MVSSPLKKDADVTHLLTPSTHAPQLCTALLCASTVAICAAATIACAGELLPDTISQAT